MRGLVWFDQRQDKIRQRQGGSRHWWADAMTIGLVWFGQRQDKEEAGNDGQARWWETWVDLVCFVLVWSKTRQDKAKTRRKQALMGRRDDDRFGLAWSKTRQGESRHWWADAMMWDVGGFVLVWFGQRQDKIRQRQDKEEAGNDGQTRWWETWVVQPHTPKALCVSGNLVRFSWIKCSFVCNCIVFLRIICMVTQLQTWGPGWFLFYAVLWCGKVYPVWS